MAAAEFLEHNFYLRVIFLSVQSVIKMIYFVVKKNQLFGQ